MPNPCACGAPAIGGAEPAPFRDKRPTSCTARFPHATNRKRTWRLQATDCATRPHAAPWLEGGKQNRESRMKATCATASRRLREWEKEKGGQNSPAVQSRTAEPLRLRCGTSHRS